MRAAENNMRKERSFEHLKIKTKNSLDQEVPNFVIGREIGRGAFGVVYKAKLLSNHSTVAVKKIRIEGMEQRQLKAVENEIKMMSQLRHKNIIGYIGVTADIDYLHIILEYINGGSLRKLLEKRGPLSEPHTAFNLIQILNGLDYLHGKGIAHRDVKGANILVCRDGTLKLADFGASKHLSHESICGGLKGTPLWMAPEVVRGEQGASGWLKADVWSVGCTAVEMLSGKMPWPDISNPMTALYRIGNGDKPPLDRNVSKDCKEFIDSCCLVDPTNRQTVRSLLHHAFLMKAKLHSHDYWEPYCDDCSSAHDMKEVSCSQSKVTEGEEVLELSVGGLPEGMEMLSTYSSDNDGFNCENATTVSTEYSPYLLNGTPSRGSFFREKYATRSNIQRCQNSDVRSKNEHNVAADAILSKVKRNSASRTGPKFDLRIDDIDAIEFPCSDATKQQTPCQNAVLNRMTHCNIDIPTPSEYSKKNYFPASKAGEDIQSKMRAPFSSTAAALKKQNYRIAFQESSESQRNSKFLEDAGKRPVMPITTTADKLITGRFFSSSYHVGSSPDSGPNTTSPAVSPTIQSSLKPIRRLGSLTAYNIKFDSTRRISTPGKGEIRSPPFVSDGKVRMASNKKTEKKELQYASPTNHTIPSNYGYLSPTYPYAFSPNSPRLPPISTPPDSSDMVTNLHLKRQPYTPGRKFPRANPALGPRRKPIRLEPIDTPEIICSPVQSAKARGSGSRTSL